MSKQDKLLMRFLSYPNDFSFQELCSLMSALGYDLRNKGSTSGSSVQFYNPDTDSKINVHRPHPGNIVKPYMLKIVAKELKEEGAL